MPIHAYFFSAGDFYQESRPDWPSYWCAIRVH